MTAMERFRRNVEILCEKRQVTYRRVSGLADLPQTTVGSWLRGQKAPTLTSLDKIAAGLGVDVALLLLDPVELEALVADLPPFPLAFTSPASWSPSPVARMDEPMPLLLRSAA